MTTVWLGESGDCESAVVEGVFATREGALRWLAEARERAIEDRLQHWHYRRARYSDAWVVKMTREYPKSDWEEYRREELAKPFLGMTEILDGEFEDGDGGIHGWWRIAERRVEP